MKVAIICDWLTNVGGAEKVLLKMHQLYPEAPIYTSKYDAKGIDWFCDADVRTGWMQIFPTGMRRFLGPLRQWYFSRLDLSSYDLIISVTGAEAKAVKSGKWLTLHGKTLERDGKIVRKKIFGKKQMVNPNGTHVSFCHVPTQYYWQMYDDYVKNPGFGVLNPLVRCGFRLLVRPLRVADLRAAQRPDFFITISEYAKEAISQYYGREATVIHPPVEIEGFRYVGGSCKRSSEVNGLGFLERHTLDREQNRPDGRTCSGRQEYTSQKSKSGLASRPRKSACDSPLREYYIVTSRQVNWKRIDLAVKACLMTQRKLLVVGEGPEHKKLVKLAEGTELVKFLPLMEKEELAELLAGAKGYLFPSFEPFGIAPVEALAAGCPVIAYGKGGAKDYVVNGKNGILFEKQTAKSLAEAILKFEKRKFDRAKISRSVKNFDEKRFDKEMKEFIREKIK